MPEFYIFFGGGARAPAAPVSHAYVLVAVLLCVDLSRSGVVQCSGCATDRLTATDMRRTSSGPLAARHETVINFTPGRTWRANTPYFRRK